MIFARCRAVAVGGEVPYRDDVDRIICFNLSALERDVAAGEIDILTASDLCAIRAECIARTRRNTRTTGCALRAHNALCCSRVHIARPHDACAVKVHG